MAFIGIPHFPLTRFSQYQEAMLWAKANRGPNEVAISHLTALNVYGISDANPDRIHITVPRSTRLRRQKPKGVVVHRGVITGDDIQIHEGIPVTTIGRTIEDLLNSRVRVDLVRQAISDARREGFIEDAEVRRLRRKVDLDMQERRAEAEAED